jgi:hypothetical protein
MKRDFDKRVVAMGDLHCGHRVGLTPPRFQSATCGHKYHHIQIELWDQYTEIIDSLKPIDILLVNGDLIDGRGKMSGGVELIAISRMKQVEIAIECLEYCEADKIVITRGTPYHTGKKEDFEDLIFKGVKAHKIGDHEWPEVNGLIFDMKHKVGNTSIPHGKGMAINKDKLWNEIWADRGLQPRATVLLRSHIHWFFETYDGYTRCIYLPALQGMGSKFGARECSGIVDWGLVYFDVKKDGTYKHQEILRRGKSERAKTTIL